MEENLKSKLGFCVFIILIIALAIGGYFFKDYIINNIKEPQKTEEKENISYKIEEDKDYIYFTNEETISAGAEINFQDIVINLKGQEVLTETLNNESKTYKSNIQYLNDEEKLSETLCNYKNDNLKSLNYRNYDVYYYDKYISLVVNDYLYTCYDSTTFKSTKSYVFDTTKGILLPEEQVLKLYNKDMSMIKDKIRDKLQNETNTDIILIDETLNNLNYGLYISKYGNLNITYLVKLKNDDSEDVLNSVDDMEVN